MSRCLTFRLAILVALAFAASVAHAAAEKPQVYWYSAPVMAGQVAAVQGEGWGEGATVGLARLPDEAPGEPGARVAVEGTLPAVTPLQVNPRSVKFVVPPGLEPGIFACRVDMGGKVSDRFYLNAPLPWWQQGDWGAEASPGGWIRVFGRCLSLGGATVALVQEGQKAQLLKPKQEDMWSLTAEIPATTAPGEYTVWVHNGKGGPAGWAKVGGVKVQAHGFAHQDRVFNVRDYGAIPDDPMDDSLAFTKALQAAADNGGGVVQFGRGRFYLQDGFVIPPHVTVRGLGQKLTHLSWPDVEEPPDAFLSGTDNFAIEDLSIFAINAKSVITSTGKAPGAANIFVRRVGIRQSRLTGRHSPAQVEQRRNEMGRNACLGLAGENVQVTDCDIATDCSTGVAVGGADCVVARNAINGIEGTYCPVSGSRVICEDNEYCRVTTGAGRCAELYFARNRITGGNWQGFREGFTTDGTGGGPGEMKIRAINGTEMTAEKPLGRTEGQTTPGAVHILDGTGAGQWRRLVGWSGNKLTIDRPWDVLPDETSVVSASNFMGHFLMIGNSWSDTGIAIQFYMSAVECVMANNTSIRSGGFRVWGRQAGPGPGPCFYNELFGNRILEGYGTEGPELGGGSSSFNIVSGYGSATYRGPMVRGVVLRDNVVDNNAGFALRSSVLDVVLENNVVRDSAYGVAAEWRAQTGLLLRGNRFERVVQPLPPGIFPYDAKQPETMPYVIHPAEAALAGLQGAELELPADLPAAWKEARQKLDSLAKADPRDPATLVQVRATVAAAAQAALEVAPGPHTPVFARSLLGLDLNFDWYKLTPLLLTSAGGQGGSRYNAGAAGWAPPVSVTTVLQPPVGWLITGADPITLASGQSVGRNLAVTVPAGGWGVTVIPVTYRVALENGARMEITEQVRLGQGAISEWLRIGPFSEKLAPPVGVMLPDEQLDVTKEYDGPAGKISWTAISTPGPRLEMKDLMEGKEPGTIYAVAALRASRPLWVSFSLDSNAGAALFVNGKPLYKRGAATLVEGDNSILAMMKGASASTTLQVNAEPLEAAAPGDLKVVPAAELKTLAALQPEALGAIPQGKGLPESLGLDWKLVYADGFGRRKLGSAWVPAGEKVWDIRDGHLLPASSFNSLAYHAKLTAPVRIEFDVMTSPGRSIVAAAWTPFGWVEPRRLWGTLAGSGYFLSLGWHNSNSKVVMRADKIVLHEDMTPLEPGKWHHVVYQFVPGRAMAIADGKVLIDHKDDQRLSGLDTISLYQYGQPQYDNVRIYTALTP